MGADSQHGMIFDIREFTVHDGPGIRTTVFMKGCPLRCAWCHNPEGISRLPETIKSDAGERVVGKEYTVERLAAILNRQAAILSLNEGGVTFSGGEPLTQGQFLSAVIDRLNDVHVLLDTSGYAPENDFATVVRKCSLVYFDLKIMDPSAHRRYTGLDNTRILGNLTALSAMKVPFVVRVPLVPGLTDSHGNLASIASFVKDLKGLVRVDLLPYNRAAGGKYRSLGMEFCPPFDEQQPVNASLKAFERLGVPAHISGRPIAPSLKS